MLFTCIMYLFWRSLQNEQFCQMINSHMIKKSFLDEGIGESESQDFAKWLTKEAQRTKPALSKGRVDATITHQLRDLSRTCISHGNIKE